MITFGSEVSYDFDESDGTIHSISVEISDSTPAGDQRIWLKTIARDGDDSLELYSEDFTLKITESEPSNNDEEIVEEESDVTIEVQ